MKWLVGGKVYDIETGTFSSAAIGVDGERIAAIEPTPRIADRDEVIDVQGSHLLPGLIDCHVHLTLNPDASDTSLYAERTLKQIRADTAAAAHATLLGGITTVRDCGGWEYLEMAVRDDVVHGRTLGPRMVLAGKLLWVETPGARDYPGMFEIAKRPEELQAAAARQLEHGADFIKVMATGMTLSPEGEAPEDNFYTVDELASLIGYAHGRGVRVACHAEGRDGIHTVVAAGTDSVEHGTQADEEVLIEMARRGTFLVPTCMVVSAYLDDPALRASAPQYIIDRFEAAKPAHCRAIASAARHGVPIAMGTDAGAPGVHHGRNADEVRRMITDAGLSSEEAIFAATLGAARLLDMDGAIGSLTPGKYADIVAMTSDPLRDPKAFNAIGFVMKGGAVVKNEKVAPDAIG